MTEMSRVAVTPDTDPSGVPTGSSHTIEEAVAAPGGTGPAATLDAQSEAEVAGIGDDRTRSVSGIPTSASDAHPSRWRPAFVDNDARPVPTTRETVKVKGGVL